MHALSIRMMRTIQGKTKVINMGYKISKSDSAHSYNLWDIEAEVLIAFLAVRLAKIRDLDAMTIVNALNFQYLRKKVKNNEMSHYAATKLQRDIINGGGY